MTPLPYPTLEEINNLFVRWLHRTDNQEPSSLPVVDHPTIDSIIPTLNNSIGAAAAFVNDHTSEAAADIKGFTANVGADIKEYVTQETYAAAPMTSAAWTDFEQFVRIYLPGIAADLAGNRDVFLEESQDYIRQITGHQEYEWPGPPDPSWSITGDVNAHTDAGIVLLQGDMNDHASSINANTDAIVPQINGHTDEALLLLQGDLNDHEESTVARINAHTDDALAASAPDFNSIIGPINAHTDDVAVALGGLVVGVPGTVNSHTDSVAALINSHTDLLLSPINAHTTSEADRVISQINAHIDTAGIGVVLDPTTLVQPINSHTDQVGNFINAHTDQQTVELPTISAGVAEMRIGIISILQDLAEALTVLGAIAAGLNVLHDWLKPFLPGQRTPEQTGEAEWDTMLLFNTPADYYEVEVNLWPQDQQGQVDIGPGFWLPRVAWCAPIAGGFFKERVFLDFTSNVVDVATRVADGLLIYAKPGTRGTVRAYRWT